MFPLMLVLAAAPKLTASPHALHLDGKEVALPSLATSVRAVKGELRVEFSPEVPYERAEQVLSALDDAARLPKVFFVGKSGPFSLDDFDGEATEVPVAPEAEPNAVLKKLHTAKGPVPKVITFKVENGTTMEHLAQFFVAFKTAGFTKLKFEPAVSPEETAPLTQREVEGIFRLNRDDLADCHTKALAQEPKLAGEVRLKFVVAPNGKISEISAVKDTTGSATLARCLVAAVKAFTFPTSAAGLSVEYPLVFKAN